MWYWSISCNLRPTITATQARERAESRAGAKSSFCKSCRAELISYFWKAATPTMNEAKSKTLSKTYIVCNKCDVIVTPFLKCTCKVQQNARFHANGLSCCDLNNVTVTCRLTCFAVVLIEVATDHSRRKMPGDECFRMIGQGHQQAIRGRFSGEWNDWIRKTLTL